MNICSFQSYEDTVFSSKTDKQAHIHPHAPKTPIKQSLTIDFAVIYFCEARKVLTSDVWVKQMQDMTDLSMKEAGDQ